jgi:hypothetical protein
MVVNGKEEDRTGTSIEKVGKLHGRWDLDLIATKNAAQGDGSAILWLDRGFAEDMLADQRPNTVGADKNVAC